MLPTENQVNAETSKAKPKTELWRAMETNRLTRSLPKKRRQQSKPKPKPNEAKAKTKPQSCNGSPKQTKKVSATTEVHEDKPKPTAFTSESLTLR